MVDNGQANAFDSFNDGLAAPPIIALGLTVRGPATDRARERVNVIQPELPVRESSILLFRCLRDSHQAAMSELTDDWVDHLETQGDYNAVADLIALCVHGRDVTDEHFRESLE